MTLLNNTESEFEILPKPVKSESDQKEYRVIRLKNGLTACLVSNIATNDPNANDNFDTSNEISEDVLSGAGAKNYHNNEAKTEKMAAAALCVSVGSFSDPKHVPGMAHFLEHMVFMGSEKFPDENDFNSFITKRGGSYNASTGRENTRFYFECLEKDLFMALDRFAQFFISPLMDRSSIAKEREVMESEFQMAVQDNTLRCRQFILSLAKNDVPVNTFAWGNLITLRDNISEDELYDGVHEFRKRHYSANRMTLSIQARLPMDVLQKYVLECFSNVPSNDLPPDDFKLCTLMFDTPEFAKFYYLQPIKDGIQVHLSWVLPSLQHKYKSKPHYYVSWVLGYEGRGSLLAYLIKKVWALTLAVGYEDDENSLYTLFSVNIVLTEEGLNHLYEVIEVVYSYINMFKKLGPQERIHNEIKSIADADFKFANERNALCVVHSLAYAMQLYPPADYLTGSELHSEYDPDDIKMTLNNLEPRKMNVIVYCNKPPSGINYSKSEKWFGTKYTQQDVPDEWLKKWEEASPSSELFLPSPNQFLTEDFTILDKEENHPDYPEKVFSSELIEIWYRKDEQYKLPDAFYGLYLINPLIVKTAKMKAMVDFYVTLLELQLNEEVFPAKMALFSCGISNGDKGITLSLSGYNQKLHLLSELIAKYIVDFKSNLREEMFTAVKEKLIEYFYNRLRDPDCLADDVRLSLIVNNYHSLVDKYNIVCSITMDSMKKFSEEFISTLYVKALVQGNVTREHAINVVKNFVSTINCKPISSSSYPKFRVCQIPKGETFCVMESFNTRDSNSIIINYYQCGTYTIKGRVIIEIVMLIIEEPLFDTLRTKEQLGYSVSCSERDTTGILGFSITVNAQATKHSTEYVDGRIEEFIKQMSQLLANMSPEAFERTKQDLIKTKRCADTHLGEEFYRNWFEIYDEDYTFDRVTQDIKELEQLVIGDVQTWWETHTLHGNKENFRKLSVQVVGSRSSQGNAEKREICDEDENKNSKLTLKFLNYDDNDKKCEDERRCMINSVAGFKDNLFLYPLVCNYTIKN